MDVTKIIAIIGVVLSTVSILFARKDRGEDDTKSKAYKMGGIDAQLQNILKQIENLSSKFDRYDAELDAKIDTKIEKAIITHEKEFHKK